MYLYMLYEHFSDWVTNLDMHFGLVTFRTDEFLNYRDVLDWNQQDCSLYSPMPVMDICSICLFVFCLFVFLICYHGYVEWLYSYLILIIVSLQLDSPAIIGCRILTTTNIHSSIPVKTSWSSTLRLTGSSAVMHSLMRQPSLSYTPRSI